MKKLIFLLASAGLLLTACIAEDSGMQEQIGEAVIIGATYEAPEAEPGTRSIIENGGAFKWSESDSFNAYSTGTTTESFEENVFEIYHYDDDVRSASASFIGYGIPGRISDVAVCPATLKPTWANQTLKVTYPNTIEWVKGEADPYMVARGFDVGAKNLSFKHLGGIIKLTVNEIPVTASEVAVTIWGGRITGEFTVAETTESSTTYWVVNDDVTDSSTPSTVTFTFTASDVDPEGMTFYVPVPVMEYSKIGFSVRNSNHEPLFSFASSEKTRTVARKQIVTFPSITFVDGGGEGSFSNVITTDSGQTGTVTLPSTKNDVYVLMNSTAGEITLVPGSEDPEEVYITVLKDATVNSLNVNLPKSTVYINGEANSNLGTLNSTTSANTLRVLKSPLTIGTATINQGNANIEGTVNSIVVASGATSDGQSAGATNQVQIFVSKDAALQTVTLNAKTDVVVEQPKDQIAVEATENKVYVIVNATGSTATAQNGGDIYVTANANCSVTAGSEDPSNKSTAKIENNTGSEAGVEIVTEAGGEISTGVVSKAKIGNVEYETLAAAITAANANDEIVILVDQTVTQGYTIDKNLTIDLNGKTITVNATSNDDQNFRTNRLFHVEGPNGVTDEVDFTLKNGTTVLDEHIWGSVRFISQGELTLTDYTSYNCRKTGANIKMSNGHATFTNVVFNSDKGGCVDIGDGTPYDQQSGAVAEMTNCTFNQTGYYDEVSSAIVTSRSGHVILNSGTYSAYYALFPHSSGGTITVKDGCTITGRQNAVHTVNHGHTTTQEDHIINIKGGTINGSFDVATDGHTTFSITGGTFDNDPSAYVATGYIAVQNGDLWTVEPLGESNSAAKIGTTYYATLVEAIDAVAEGQTITLTSDLDFSQAPYDVYKWAGSVYNPLELCVNNVTIDLNGHTISEMGNSALAIGHLLAKDGRISNLTVKNGTLLAGKTDNVTNSYVLLIAGVDGMTVKNVTTNGGINVCSGSADVVIEDCTINGTKYYTVCSQTGSEVTIKGTTYTKNTDATVANKSMFWIQGVGTDSDMNTDANPSGAFGASSITIEDGNYTVDFSNGGVFYLTSGVAPTLKGGTYNFDPSAYVAPGYVATHSGNVWTVAPISGVAAIGTQGYETLAAAFAAVQDNETITLLKDIALSSTEEYEGKDFVLNGDGHTINSAAAITTSTYPLAFGDANFAISNATFTSQWTTENKQNYNVLVYASSKETTALLSNVSISSNQQTALCVQGYNSNITTVTLEDLTITNTGTRTGSDAYRSAAVATAFGGKVIINSGTYSSEVQAVRQFSSGGDITINGGTFSGKIVAHLDKGSYSQYPAIITINGGTFDNCSFEVIHNNGDTSANIVIYGGTFDADPSAYVAPGYVATESGNVWTVTKLNTPVAIGSVGYETLDAAVEAAIDGQTVTILQAGNYTIPAITKTLTIEAAVDDVVVNHTTNSSIANISSGKTATFKNITFNLGDTQKATAHGFGTLNGSNGALVMNGCTINGALNLFGVSTFTNCTFAVSGTEKYNIWAVNGNASFTGCSFTNTTRAVNVYDQKHGEATNNVSFTNCTFEGTTAKKAAINVHYSPEKEQIVGDKFVVSIDNCTTTGTWASTPEAKEAETTICNNTLWMVSDIKNYNLGDITITVDGFAQDLTWGVAKIGNACYPTLAAAVSAVGTNETITLLDNVALSASETTLHFKDKSFNINGAKTIDLSASTQKYPWWFENGTFNLSNITVTSTGHDYAVLFTKSDGNSNGTLNNVTINSIAETALCFDESNSFTLNGVTVSQTGSNSTDWRNVAVATSGGATVTIESGSYSSEYGWAVRHFSSGGNITINGGSFSGKIKAHLDKGSYSKFPAIITINGGTFTNCTLEVEHNSGDTSANIVINGGTFDCDPTAYLGAGHTATHIDNTWTVQ